MYRLFTDEALPESVSSDPATCGMNRRPGAHPMRGVGVGFLVFTEESMSRRQKTRRRARRRVSVPAVATVAGKVPVHVRDILEWVADRDRRTLSKVVRDACERYAEQESGHSD